MFSLTFMSRRISDTSLGSAFRNIKLAIFFFLPFFPLLTSPLNVKKSKICFFIRVSGVNPPHWNTEIQHANVRDLLDKVVQQLQQPGIYVSLEAVNQVSHPYLVTQHFTSCFYVPTPWLLTSSWSGMCSI